MISYMVGPKCVQAWLYILLL